MGKPLCIIAGVGNATGIGASSAREFEKTHRIAVLGRRVSADLVKQIEAAGGEALVCQLKEYSPEELRAAYKKMYDQWQDSHLGVAIWNASFWWSQPFLDTEVETIKSSTNINILCAFVFAQEAVKGFLAAPQNGPQRGALLVTGATSATRGAAMFSAFAAGKHGLRAMTQSVAREFGPQGIHACFVIVDGTVATSATRRNFGSREDKDEGWLEDRMQSMSPDSVGKTYRWLSEQSPDCWTFELDLRPAKEKW